MEEELWAHLLAGCSFPVAWGSLGPGTGTPRAAMFRVGAATQELLEHSGPTETRVQIDAYGSNFDEAIKASREIKAALHRYVGTLILGAFLVSIRDQDDDDADLLSRVSMTFLITHREA